MKKKKDSIGVSFLLDKNVHEKLVNVSEYLGQSKTIAVERAIVDYYDKNMETGEKRYE